MEIEAKYRITNPAQIARLLRARGLGAYQLSPAGVEQVTDRYFDTPDLAIWRDGFACRVRESGDHAVLTLKGRGDALGAVHQREEIDQEIPPGLHADSWPDGDVQARTIELASGHALEEIATIHQHRTRRAVHRGDDLIGELTVDRTEIHAAGAREQADGVEIELDDLGTREDLDLLGRALRKFELDPEPRSKFEIALSLREASAARADGPFPSLSPDEKRRLEEIAASADSATARRARIVLLAAAGIGSTGIGRQIEVSDSYVRRWMRRFRSEGMAIFAREDESEPEPDEGEPVSAGRGSAGRPITVRDLCSRCGVDLERAGRVAAVAGELFDRFRALHGVPASRRPLLESAALMVDAGASIDSARPHAAGRDLAAAEELAGFSPRERSMLACILRFQGKRVRPDSEPLFAQLPLDFQGEALALAALLRVAVALAGAAGSSSLTTGAYDRDGASIEVDGVTPEEAAGIERRADLWRDRFGAPLRVLRAGASPGSDDPDSAESAGKESVEAAAKAAPKGPGLRGDDPIREAGRKVMALQFERLLAHEAGTAEGGDIEELHDMRVATRRMRAAMDLFQPYLPNSAGELVRGLRRAGRALGPVRDLDVLLEHAEKFAESTGQGDGLDPLLESWRADRESSRRSLIAFLGSREYARFKKRLADFVSGDVRPSGSLHLEPLRPSRRHLRTVAPSLLWDRFGRVLSYEPALDGAPIDTLHALRIEFKRLRYALEFFREPLGRAVDPLIAQVTEAQDHLGALHDADVAALLIRRFVVDGRRRHGRGPQIPGGSSAILRYLESREDEIRDRIESFPNVWTRILRPDFRRLLGEITAAL